MKWLNSKYLAAKLAADLHQDERITRNTQQASVWAVLAAYTYLIIEIIYKVITTKSVDDCGWAIGLILIISVVLLIAEKGHIEAMLPRSLNRKLLPTNTSGRKKRSLHYVLNSLWLSAGIVIVSAVFHYGLGIQDVQFEGVSALKGAVQMFIPFFAFSLLFNWIIGEHAVKKYNKQCDALEEDSDIR